MSSTADPRSSTTSQPQPNPTAIAATTNTSSSSSTSTSRPKVSLSSSSHLDPGAYVRGSHPITIGRDTVIHPRTHLISIHAAVSIGDHCIVSEKAVIGGPLPPPSSQTPSTAVDTDSSTTTAPAPAANVKADEPAPPPTPTKIHSHVYIHPHSVISHSVTIESYALIESHVAVLPGVKVGAHSKACSGVTIDRDVEPWSVVMANGTVRRSRRRRMKVGTGEGEKNGGNGSGDDDDDADGKDEGSNHRNEDDRFEEDEVEMGRVKMMGYERATAKTILQNVAKAASLARKK